MVDDLDVGEVAAWAEGLAEVHARIGPRFARSEPRRRVAAYVRGLLAPVERKNSWTLAERAGEASPDGMQRLLMSADWDADLVRDDLREYVVEHLGDPGGVLVVDETGFLKKGTKSAGVARQYSGTAGRIENAQVGVFLAYATALGPAFLDRELYLPAAWTADRERCAQAGIGDRVQFATKPELAMAMLTRAMDAGVPAQWVTGDEVYGQQPKLRALLVGRGMSYVLAVPVNQRVFPAAGGLLCELRADACAATVAAQAWKQISAGPGAKGPRIYHWARVLIRPADQAGMRHYWSVAACPTRPTWRTTCALAGPTPRCASWCGWPVPAGPSRSPSRAPRVRSVWTSTRSAVTTPGTGTSPWPCWPMRS